MPQSSSTHRTVAIDTHGCKLNQADSQQLARQFADAGFRLVSLADGPDVYVLNTCTVTHVADAKARQALRTARRRNPGMRMVATGCYAQREPAKLAAGGVADVVIGNDGKSGLVAKVAAMFPSPPPLAGANGAAGSAPWRLALGRTRASVKIQEGCNQVCAYCIVPKVRGRERSVPTTSLVESVRRFEALGFKEVTLTGTQLGSYGHDLSGDVGLKDMLAILLSETAMPRIRVSSLQPQELTDDVLALWRNARLCPHFHMPLQSGSDRILSAMRRRYTASEYVDATRRIFEMYPHASVTADVIVGFPGETDCDFEETFELCERLDFAALHVFPYSTRPGTSAAHIGERTAPAAIRSRKEAMLRLAEEKMIAFRRRALGQTRWTLWEREVSPNRFSGLTDNYLRVEAKGANLLNQITRVRLTELNGVLLGGLVVTADDDSAAIGRQSRRAEATLPP